MSTKSSGTLRSPTLTQWLADQPHTTDPEHLAELTGTATVVGFGTTTREAHEIFRLVEAATLALADRGFRTVALLENPRVTALFDMFVTGETIDIDAALSQAWGPVQTQEMRAALTTLREWNAARKTDPVRIIGVTDETALISDYDQVVELVGAIDPDVVGEVADLLDTVRVAHDGGEHVERAKGTHPGTPFVDLAKEARAKVSTLPDSPDRAAALELLRHIVTYHGNAIGVGYDSAKEERQAANRILDHHRNTGARVVLWEGSAHTAAHPAPSVGAFLRQELRDDYLAVHVTFGQGTVERTVIPAPRTDSLEGHLAAAEGPRTVDLRSAPGSVVPDLSRSWLTRLISGMYDPSEDHKHYFEFTLADAFDALVYIPTITPTQSLGET